MSTSVRASHILLMHADAPDTASKRSKAAALEAVVRLRDRIRSGDVQFAEAARIVSECPSSEEGGDLGSFSPGVMVPEFDKAVFALSVGDMSDVVETAFGYHLILRTA